MSFGDEKTNNNTQNNDDTVEETEGTEAASVSEDNAEIEQEMDASEKVKVLEAQLDAICSERDRLKDDYVRAHAEMENIRRRERKDSEQRVVNTLSSFGRDLLTVADTFTRALQSLPSKEEIEANYDSNIKNMIIGIEMTEKEFSSAFENSGIKKVASLGKVFDPNLHQVVQEIEHDADAGVIVQELQAGYTVKGKLLREAMVVVSKGGASKSTADGGEKPDTGGNVDKMV
ncbi:MAG: nucleotide exchange factor GrpE [Alphaproteobacteria bacterium]|nr:nucleotide exchange factor GrpE [Alphaproteobacteria bacterium]